MDKEKRLLETELKFFHLYSTNLAERLTNLCTSTPELKKRSPELATMIENGRLQARDLKRAVYEITKQFITEEGGGNEMWLLITGNREPKPELGDIGGVTGNDKPVHRTSSNQGIIASPSWPSQNISNHDSPSWQPQNISNYGSPSWPSQNLSNFGSPSWPSQNIKNNNSPTSSTYQASLSNNYSPNNWSLQNKGSIIFPSGSSQRMSNPASNYQSKNRNSLLLEKVLERAQKQLPNSLAGGTNSSSATITKQKSTQLSQNPLQNSPTYQPTVGKRINSPTDWVSNDCKRRKNEQAGDDSYEAKLRSDIVPPNDIDVTFDDIGALQETKELIEELVILPINRPELFTGSLLKPCKGLLLFGPPGTGKTMLAKAIAKECGANFISVCLSSIFCKWLGESEKNVKALFTLAAKVAPTVIFVDEIDSLLGKRTSHEQDTAYRKVKNEFMSLWDGLRTKDGEQVLVLGATNRPFDLDEAIIRRFQRRVFVDLPCEQSRESILKKLLAKEKVVNMNFKELAVLTDGYSGSDLKNLCIAAAYQPLKELLAQERLLASGNVDGNIQKEQPLLRPLTMDDMKQAKKKVAASFSSNGSSMAELKKWNDLYGEGGSRMN